MPDCDNTRTRCLSIPDPGSDPICCVMLVMVLSPATSHIFSLSPFQGSRVTLQLFFLDGEEAFGAWSEADSLYGARNLAQRLEKEPMPGGGGTRLEAIVSKPTNVLEDLPIISGSLIPICLLLTGSPCPPGSAGSARSSDCQPLPGDPPPLPAPPLPG